MADGSRARIPSNYFDLAMVMDYWSEKRLNHHTEATTMLYGAREAARVMLEEGWRPALPGIRWQERQWLLACGLWGWWCSGRMRIV